MSIGKTLGKVVGGVVGLAVVTGAGGYVWGKSAASARLSHKYETHRVDFPIPFPLSDEELAALKQERLGKDGVKAEDPLAGVDLAALAKERAIARGKHLVEHRYVCVECHGKNFGGGTMIDDPAMGRFFGVNLTLGKGSQTASYTPADWDRIVRHGVKPDGTPAVMPSADFFEVSDHELSDIVSYIRSLPPVDAEIARPVPGPVGTMLVATGKLMLSADLKKDHQAAHDKDGPPVAETVEFGKHLAQVCTGCHRPDLSGGKILAGPPSWPPAHNLTPGPDGLQGWTYDDFLRALREGKAKDGSPLKSPMSLMPKYASGWTDVELKALWAYVQSVPPQATPKE